MTRPIAAGLLAALATGAFAVAPALAQDEAGGAAPRVEISTMMGDEYGRFLVGANDLPVYMFTGDTRGGAGTEATRACDPRCQEEWPPVVTQGEPSARGEVRTSLLGTIPHFEEDRQVTYDGMPLYYYTGDEGGDRPTGQDKSGFGGEWSLVRPSGERVGG